MFWICRSCDRGQQYCGDRCRQKTRRRQRREANRRHQQSGEGRLDHRDRQRAYRSRRRQACVTDQSSSAGSSPARIASQESISGALKLETILMERTDEELSVWKGYSLPRCRVCGRSSRFMDAFLVG